MASGLGGAVGIGAAGLSIAVQILSGEVLLLSDDSFDLASLPEITADYVTCTSEYISFKDETIPIDSGNVLWNFGANATSQFSTNNPSSTAFSVIGMQDITQGSNVYADFINITCSVDASASSNGTTISANTSGAMYQWVDCNTGYFALPGETNQIFTPTSSGDYAVVVTENDCSDTSACYNIIIFGIDENESNLMNIYPNPFNDEMNISFSSYISNGVIRIWDLTGKLIEEFSIENVSDYNYKMSGPNGVYIVELLTDYQHITHRVIKN